MWGRKRLSCREAGGKRQFSIKHGQVFRVRRPACRKCGERVTAAKGQQGGLTAAKERAMMKRCAVLLPALAGCVVASGGDAG